MKIGRAFARITLAVIAFWAMTQCASAVQPQDWQIYMQEPASPIALGMVNFHNLLLIIIGFIVILVSALLLWVMFRYREEANPVPSRTSHNTTIEIIWTVVPVLILVVIAIPSFRLLYAQNAAPKEADVVVKAVGNQWYWSYEYPQYGFTFDSYLVEDDDLKPDQPRLFTVDNEVVLPVNRSVNVLITASDVIHSWGVPALGPKLDAIPGRANLLSFVPNVIGTHYGQCYELCGSRHAYMPIAVRVVPEDEFQKWVEKAKAEFAALEPAEDRPQQAQLEEAGSSG